MKFFTIIFNTYLLALSLFPCADVDSCVETNSAHISSINNNNKEDHKETENCTPFCSCACCAAPIFHQAISVKEPLKQTYLTLKFPSLKINYPSHSSSAIWQPPKFC